MNSHLLISGDLLVDLTVPKVMGVININDNSFYSGSRVHDEKTLLRKVENMLIEGVDIIDLGATSSRPGSLPGNPKEEVGTLVKAIQIIKKEFPQTFVSVDTVYGVVAQEVIDHGANMINDISAGNIDATILEVVARHNVPYVLMHMKGLPENMQQHTKYNDMMMELLIFFSNKIKFLKSLGIHQMVIDPGIGFSKDISGNFLLIKQLESFTIFDVPVLIGISRKSFIYKTLETSADQALNGTTALHSVALLNGASILRTHDVRSAKETILLLEMLKKG